MKSKAAEWRADPSSVGIYGSSTGSHIAILLAMRPHDARYNAIPLEGAPNIDASVAYLAARSPITHPYARWQQAEKVKRARARTTTRARWQDCFGWDPRSA